VIDACAQYSASTGFASPVNSGRFPPEAHDRAASAARKAIASPLLESSIEGARGLLLTIAGNAHMGLLEVTQAAEVIGGVSHEDANIIFGTVIDESLGESMRVTVIAAGFDRWDDSAPRQDEGAASAHRSLPDPFAETDEADGESTDELELDIPSFLR